MASRISRTATAPSGHAPRTVLDDAAPAVPEALLLRPLGAVGDVLAQRALERRSWPTNTPTARTRPTNVHRCGAERDADEHADARRGRRRSAPPASCCRCACRPSRAAPAAASASRAPSAARRSPSAMATPVTNVRPISVRPSSEMMTVMPAKITARPLVSIASTTASSTSAPACKRLAVAGDDEQGVVDADAEADHRHHRRREVGHRRWRC